MSDKYYFENRRHKTNHRTVSVSAESMEEAVRKLSMLFKGVFRFITKGKP